MDLKLLQKDIAQMLSVTEDSIVNWENNRSLPQVQFYPKIINFLSYLPFEIDKSSFSGRLKAYRYLNGLSQYQLGKIVGVDESTVCSWELGENQPLKRWLIKLNTLFNEEQLLH